MASLRENVQRKSFQDKSYLSYYCTKSRKTNKFTKALLKEMQMWGQLKAHDRHFEEQIAIKRNGSFERDLRTVETLE